jgi:predicted porin
MQAQQHTLAAAVALLLAGAALPAAAADSAFNVYGRIDLGVSSLQDVTKAGAKSVWNVKDSSTGRWGLKGNYDLGNGRDALFQLENRFFGDTGTQDGSVQWKDKAFVGLADASLGEVRLGRMSSPIDEAGVNGRFEAFGGDSLASMGTRGAKYLAKWDNAVYYRSPAFMGFKVAVATSLGEAAKKRADGVQAEYANGPLVVSLAYQTDSSAATAAGFTFDTTTGTSKAVAAVAADDWNTTSLGASYDFGSFKLMTTYAQSSDVGASNLGGETVWTVGAQIPAGPGQIRVSYRDVSDSKINGSSTAADVSHQRLGLGYQWPLNKGTSLNFSLVNESYKKGTAAKNSANSAEVAIRLNF